MTSYTCCNMVLAVVVMLVFLVSDGVNHLGFVEADGVEGIRGLAPLWVCVNVCFV